MIEPNVLEDRIKADLIGAEVRITSNDLVHYEAYVIFSGFKGKNLLEQHRMVYHALGDDMKTNIHAFKLKTQTPKE